MKVLNKKSNVYLLVDAHSDNEYHITYYGYNPDDEGKPNHKTCPNRWLDMEGKWFKIQLKNSDAIYITRKWTRWTGTNKSSMTFGTFKFGNIEGFVCEPYGEETTASGKDKRIPVGTYNLKWHVTKSYPKNKYTLEHTFGKRHNLDFPPLKNGVVFVYNDKVSKGRGILIHAGRDGGWTVGCILPSKNLNKDINKWNMDITESVETLHEILDKIEEIGIEKVKLIIKDEIF